MNPIGNIRLYACGGAGMNLGSQLERHRGNRENGFGTLDVVYVDTSKSNVRDTISKEHMYLLEGLDGSGKVRSENHEQISNQIRAILQQFKPADLNIVLHSAAGGSGSVIGPLITSELLNSQIPVVVLAIGSADTRLDAENTLKTIKSYEAISGMRKAPVAMYYVENSRNTPRNAADELLRDMVVSLCVLFSRQNRELDSKDLFNWLRYDRVTSFHTQLVGLYLMGLPDTPELGNIISVATLAQEGADTVLAQMPEYQCVGYIPKDVKGIPDTMHFVTCDGVFHNVTKNLQNLLSEFKSAQEARIPKNSILEKHDNPQSTGLVL